MTKPSRHLIRDISWTASVSTEMKRISTKTNHLGRFRTLTQNPLHGTTPFAIVRFKSAPQSGKLMSAFIKLLITIHACQNDKTWCMVHANPAHNHATIDKRVLDIHLPRNRHADGRHASKAVGASAQARFGIDAACWSKLCVL